MIWESWNAFFEMGGYGLYVWGSVLLTFALLFGELFALALRWNAGMERLGSWLRSEEMDNDENQG